MYSLSARYYYVIYTYKFIIYSNRYFTDNFKDIFVLTLSRVANIHVSPAHFPRELKVTVPFVQLGILVLTQVSL